MIEVIENNISKIAALCKTHKVESLFLFGSAARGELKKNSDLDFLVKFSTSIDVLDYADNYFDLLEHLKQLFKRNVDLVSVRSLKNPIFIDELNKTKVSLYGH